jgi:CPA1 family monovalent cation:H+ antiporter
MSRHVAAVSRQENMASESVEITLILFLAVVFSGALAKISPIALPLPLVQIALGFMMAVVTGTAVELDPELFFLLFLPPLLFLDGWRIPKEGLLRDKGTILELALGLVVFTVLGIGFLVHWMIPGIPLAVAFALAAVVSPTDPVAVSAIASRVPIPHRLMHILEGESLLNDASGLVCMRFAVAAALTGTFSVGTALGTFAWLAIGGLVIGIGVTWLVTKARDYAASKLGEEPGSHILVSLLVPFGAYLLAEHFHCSGILAAVSAGMTMSFVEQLGRTLPATRIRQGAVWDMVQFSLNGIMFVLLGEQLPRLVSGAASVVQETGHHDPIWLLAYAATITIGLAALRLAWVWISLRFVLFRAAKQGKAITKPNWRLVLAMSIAGVRGAITLAGILTLPLVMNDGSPFPARDLVILLAAGVIVISLVIASVGLPMLLKDLKLPPESAHEKQEDDARLASAEAAIKAVERFHQRLSEVEADAEINSEAVARLISFYQQRIDGRSKTGDDAARQRRMEDVERQMRLVAIRAEREEVYRLGRMRKLSDDIVRKLVREIDLVETRLNSV